MKGRLLIPLITAVAALGSGVASANSAYWAKSGLLLEVSADPRDGSDFVQTNPVHAQRLELVALNDNVRLRDMTVTFSDGRTFSQAMSTIRPGEHVMVDLPENCGVIQNVELAYGRQIVDRTPARLQIIPHEVSQISQVEARPIIRDQRWSNDAWRTPQPTYTQRYAEQPYATPASVIRPTAQVQPQRTGWSASGYIRGSLRF